MMTKSGSKIATDQSIYPKKLGIRMPLASAIPLTRKLGAFPMYVLAPMNTAPTEMAVSSLTNSGFAAVPIEHFVCYRFRHVEFPERGIKEGQVGRRIVKKTG